MQTLIQLIPTQAPGILPEWLLSINLLDVFFYYISTIVAISVILRIRLFLAVYTIAEQLAACTNIRTLLARHWWHFLVQGVVSLGLAYVIVFGVYLLIARGLAPQCAISLREFCLPSLRPSFLIFALIASLMVAIDFHLLFRVAVLDVPQIQQTLWLAELALGNRITKFIDWAIGSQYNPIRWIADHKARETLAWLGEIFRTSLELMVFQMGLRLAVVLGLFAGHLWLTFITPTPLPAHPSHTSVVSPTVHQEPPSVHATEPTTSANQAVLPANSTAPMPPVTDTDTAPAPMSETTSQLEPELDTKSATKEVSESPFSKEPPSVNESLPDSKERVRLPDKNQ